MHGYISHSDGGGADSFSTRVLPNFELSPPPVRSPSAAGASLSTFSHGGGACVVTREDDPFVATFLGPSLLFVPGQYTTAYFRLISPPRVPVPTYNGNFVIR